jgi:hypothetical protein
MRKIILILLLFCMYNLMYSQDHIINLGCDNFTNISINYERVISSDFNLRVVYSRSFIDGYSSPKNFTYDFSSLSVKIFNGDIFNCEFYHGPSILIGSYYEYPSFQNNISTYQNSSTISPEYHIGLQREVSDNILASIELDIGTHFLFNDYMDILDKYNMGNFIPYIGFSLYVGYNYPNSILDFSK